MKNKMIRLSLAVALLTLTSHGVLAQKRDSLEKFRYNREETYYSGYKELSKRTNLPIALHQVGFKVTETEPFKIGKQYLDSNYSVLGIPKSELTNLKEHASRENPTGFVVRYRQFHKTIPVGDNEVTIITNKENEVDVVWNGFRKLQKDLSITPNLSDSLARQVGINYLKSDS